jgi:hypothetical protein
MAAQITERFSFSAASSNVALVDPGAGKALSVYRISALLDKRVTATAVAVRIGFGTTTTPTGPGVVLTHPGLAPGSGVVETLGGGSVPLGQGLDGQKLFITSDAPTGGTLEVLATYSIDPD